MAPTITVSATGKVSPFSPLRFVYGTISFPELEGPADYEYTTGGEDATLAQLSGGKINTLYRQDFEPVVLSGEDVGPSGQTITAPDFRLHALMNAARTKVQIFHPFGSAVIHDAGSGLAAVEYNPADGGGFSGDFAGAADAGAKVAQLRYPTERELPDNSVITGLAFNYFLIGRYIPA